MYLTKLSGTTLYGNLHCLIHPLALSTIHPQYLDVLSGEIEKNLYKICIIIYRFIYIRGGSTICGYGGRE
jgi:hypothetical protein